jgi:hypothetical protein
MKAIRYKKYVKNVDETRSFSLLVNKVKVTVHPVSF